MNQPPRRNPRRGVTEETGSEKKRERIEGDEKKVCLWQE